MTLAAHCGYGRRWCPHLADGGRLPCCSWTTPCGHRASAQRGREPRRERTESYPHLSVDPVREYCHVSIHSWPVGLGTAGPPARVPNQPPDAVLQSDQRTTAVTLRDTASCREQNFKLHSGQAIDLAEKVGRGLSGGTWVGGTPEWAGTKWAGLSRWAGFASPRR